MSGFSALLPVIQGIGSVFSSMNASRAASDSGDAQAAAYNYNAAVMRNNAVAAEQQADANKQQQDRINRAKLGKLRTDILHQGVLLEGTPLLLLAEESAQGELESQKILHEGRVKATNYRNQATLDDYQASVVKSAAQNRSESLLTSGIFKGISQVGSSLLKG